ncbi:hypothetical protein [Alicyclobacillus dauci]|uniref:EVE domain-containing protein n=1 Tax=Alicyclobacillus dauci TaxID=1475485 RepID=A0ABY6Z453_9BACL|nr:hypothetical protein [Alicyclobacillus dauci]WAH37539.1 hypothetical protein NZD86_03115 [Alicyclobacillus dauci]
MDIVWYNRSIGTPMVTVAATGLTFNQAAVIALNNPDFIWLGYARDKQWIVVQPVQENKPEVFPFASRKRDKHVRVQSRDFIRFLSVQDDDFDLGRTVRVPSYWDTDLSLLIVDLSKAEMDGEDEDMSGEVAEPRGMEKGYTTYIPQ